MTAPRLVRQVVEARLLVLQSKRLLLISNERRLNESGLDFYRERVLRLRAEVAAAQHQYRESLISWGTPEWHDYWPTAYGRLIEMGTSLSDKMRSSIDDMPVGERYEISTNVEMLEKMVGRWAQCRREAMAASVA